MGAVLLTPRLLFMGFCRRRVLIASFPQERELRDQGLGLTHSSVHVPNRKLR